MWSTGKLDQWDLITGGCGLIMVDVDDHDFTLIIYGCGVITYGHGLITIGCGLITSGCGIIADG